MNSAYYFPILFVILLILFIPSKESNSQVIFRPVDETGIQVGTRPIGLALNSDMNKLYVAYEFSDRVSVIDIRTGSQIKSIPVERFPHQIASDPAINRIYVTNEGSRSVSVIDGDTDTLMDPIRLGGKPVDISVDPVSHRAVVVNGLNIYNVSTIDIFSDSIVGSNVTLGNSKGRSALNSYTDIIFATIPEKSSLLGIEGSTNLPIVNVTGAFHYPYDLVFNPISNILYIVDERPSLNIINGTTNEVVQYNIALSEPPSAIVINPLNNVVYLANSRNNTVLPFIFNGSTTGFGAYINVGEDPQAIVIDPYRNLIYVANSGSNTVSIIDGNENRPLVGVKFVTKPENIGSIYCKDASDTEWEKIFDNLSLYPIGASLDCKAETDLQTDIFRRFALFGNLLWELQKAFSGGDKFAYWTGTVLQNPVKGDIINFTADTFGSEFTANFEDDADATLLPVEYRNILIGLAIPAVAGWIYKKRDVFFKKKRSEYANRYSKIIEAADQTYFKSHNKEEYIENLKHLRKQIAELFGTGKIDEADYSILNNRISESERQIT